MLFLAQKKLVRLFAAFALVGVAQLRAMAVESPVVKTEKTRLEVGTAGSGTTSLPLFVALDGGYFAKRGLHVSVNQVGATVAVQGIISGTIFIRAGPPPSPPIWRAPISSTLPRQWIAIR